MSIGRLRLAGQRREVRELAQTAAQRWSAASTERRRARAAFGARLKRPETLVLAVVSGLTVGMVAPQGRRGQPPEKRRPMRNNAALRQAVSWVRTYTIGRVLKALTDIAMP